VAKRTRAMKCPKCTRYLIKFGGTVYNTVTGETKPFTVGRVCRICEIFYIDKRFKDVKIIYSDIGGRQIHKHEGSNLYEKIVL